PTDFDLLYERNDFLVEDGASKILLEEWTYHEDFEDRELGAWASYPLWQDIAYNQNFRVNEMISGDPNISIVQKVTPYTAVDNYAGAQKLLDMYLVPGAQLSFRTYLKSHLSSEWFKVRFAAGEYGKIDVTFRAVPSNKWQEFKVSYDDIITQNPKLNGNSRIEIYALAFLVKFDHADPDMPIYFGLDDISFKGARPVSFHFTEPEMYKLPEYKPYIPKNHYVQGEEFHLNGTFPDDAEEISVDISSFNNPGDKLFHAMLSRNGGVWKLDPFKIDFPPGLYQGQLIMKNGGDKIGETTFTIHISPPQMGGKHPRLLFDQNTKSKLEKKFEQEPYLQLLENTLSRAKDFRSKIPVESLNYDLDQFPDENWLATWDAWGSHIYHTGEALRLNARAYAFGADQEAGEYVKAVLLRLASWPDWTHPWQTKRGRYSEHRTGSWSHRVAEAYDLTYDLMQPEESHHIRDALMKNIVKGVHRTFIYNDNVTAATSNWLAMTVGGSLMCMSAIYEDGSDVENLEPYFTGAMIKLNKFLNLVTDSKDGAWGEGFGYNNYTFSNLSYSLPSIDNVFNIDLTGPLVGTYNEFIWAGLIKDKLWFEHGDSHGHLNSATNWAYLLSKTKDPRLSWFYHFLNAGHDEESTSPQVSYEDVIFDTDVPQKDPFDQDPVKLFRDIGTVVFKSGWEADDFVFVMRSGPTYNHQHLDKGSIWFADHNSIFVEERSLTNSNYYDDPIYESWLTQPVGHSTILIDGNHQSQRVGDHLHFAPGFDDYAFISHFLNGEHAAFATGDIGRLYWGKVKELSRNVLYLKPRILLMLDVAEPNQEDHKVTLLYQSKRLEDIHPDEKHSSITKDGASMEIYHLTPDQLQVEAVETPHYLKTLRNDRPLVREGMLTVSATTHSEPLVIANLITSGIDGTTPEITTNTGSGFVSGVASGANFAFSTKPGEAYTIEDKVTDALALTWDEKNIFAAKVRHYQDGGIRLDCDEPLTFELISNSSLRYYVEKNGKLTITLARKPRQVLLNGVEVEISYNKKSHKMVFPINGGEGTIVIK
ncbi:MAG: heparinase II/III family protein, partial [Saprospiraceae bacterium]|nr:heparinase II/III family protein [Saprospiraceae bacterium]